MVLSEGAANTLRSFSWSESYHCDISVYRSLYAGYGCPLPLLVDEFLVKFGGLHIRHKMSLTQNQVDFFQKRKREDPTYFIPQYIEIEFNFDVIKVPKLNYIRRKASKICDDYADEARRANVSTLWPIGTYDNLSYDLVMSERGSVFAYTDPVLLFIAPTGEQAIEALLTTEGFPEIPE